MKIFTTLLAQAMFGMIGLLGTVAWSQGQTTQPDPQAAPTTQPSGADMTASTIPAVGTPAPGFTLSTNSGSQVSLSDFAGKKMVVLYFYPKAGTPGCTTEACAFRDALAEYDKANIEVLGISPDHVDDINKFGTKYHLNFTLLADTDHAVAQAYGVWQQKNMMGKTFFGVARTTFVIGKDGNILHVFEKVKPAGHDQQVLSWIQQNVDPNGKS